MIFDQPDAASSSSPARVLPRLLGGATIGAIAGILIWNPLAQVEDGWEPLYLFLVVPMIVGIAIIGFLISAGVASLTTKDRSLVWGRDTAVIGGILVGSLAGGWSAKIAADGIAATVTVLCAGMVFFAVSALVTLLARRFRWFGSRSLPAA